MKAWSDWFPDLLPQLPGCPDPLVEHELRSACQEFFTRTRAWKVIEPPVAIAAGKTTVAIAPSDAEQELVRLDGAWLDGKRLGVEGAGAMDNAFSDDWTKHTGATLRLVQVVPGEAMLHPVPLAASVTGLALRLSVKPSEVSTGLPDDLFSKYKSALSSGALSRLMLQAGMPWASPNLGAFHSGRFESAINTATIDAARSFGTGRISSRPSWF